MNVFDQIRLIVYRVHEKGLEVLMLNEETPDGRLPATYLSQDRLEAMKRQGECIQLDDARHADDQMSNVAIEADWHDIPSVRAIIKHDINRLERKVKEVLPEVEGYTYVAIKDAFKKALPHEYEALKELKDIMSTRNMIQNI